MNFLSRAALNKISFSLSRQKILFFMEIETKFQQTAVTRPFAQPSGGMPGE